MAIPAGLRSEAKGGAVKESIVSWIVVFSGIGIVLLCALSILRQWRDQNRK